MSIILLLLYAITIQYERGGAWRVFGIVGIIALPLDALLNYTELALLTWDFPKQGEWTFSTRLRRLQYNTDWRGDPARLLVLFLNWIAPSGQHIKR